MSIIGSYKGQKNKSRDEMFWAKVKQQGPNDCWPWLASLNKDGYGQFWIGYTFVPAHRYAYVYKHREQLQEGILICHHCDNPACCNPNHLFEGTALDNARDRVSKNRSGDSTPIHPARGSAHKMSKLEDKDIINIRHLVETGVPQIELAKAFNISAAQISSIVSRKNWRHI